MNQAFTVRVEHDLESGWLVGKVLELPGRYTQTRDLESLRTNVVEAIEVYLESVGAPHTATG